jgi:MinD-like ATPase involved in chromosome partitioning or flagellar assembly
MGKIIAIYGNGASGKTTLAAKLATELSDIKHSVLIVSTDYAVPSLPIILPSMDDKGRSLGKAISAVDISQALVLQNTLGVSKQLGVIAYLKGEHSGSYIPITEEKAEDFIRTVKYLAEYIIIDCRSDIETDVLGATAINRSDLAIRSVTPDARGLSFVKSVDARLASAGIESKATLRILNNIQPFAPADEVDVVLQGNKTFLPHVPQIERQMMEGELFQGTKSKAYSKTIKGIADMIREL